MGDGGEIQCEAKPFNRPTVKTLASKNYSFQTQQVLCLLCMTEGENPNMIHYFPF